MSTSTKINILQMPLKHQHIVQQESTRFLPMQGYRLTLTYQLLVNLPNLLICQKIQGTNSYPVPTIKLLHPPGLRSWTILDRTYSAQRFFIF